MINSVGPSLHELHEGLGDHVEEVEGVDEVGEAHGLLHPAHQQVAGVHRQVAQRVVTLPLVD